MLPAILGILAISFAISWSVTGFMKWFAPRINFVDKPGHRKIHAKPKPLGGGVAIFLGIAIPIAATLLIAHTPLADRFTTWHHYLGGVRLRTPLLLTFLASMFVLHLMGLFDDRRALGPYVKLLIQLAVTVALVAPFPELWSLTALDESLNAHGILAVAISVLWITGVTNAFNFLDNMDGLSAGTAAVCTVAFLITALSIGQLFVAATLAMLLGALVGFLCYNFNPASIFMGDSGSLLIGFTLGVLTVRTTYLPEGTAWGAGWYSVLAPVIVLAVPLYDLIVVSTIRISRGRSPFVGDTNHLSHRLVARGMSKRTAVLCIYLITASTAVAAIILPHVQSGFAALLIFVQTVLVLCVVALLEQHPLPIETNTESLVPKQENTADLSPPRS